ncbi:unnamed protein product [Peniophora sp. CBMAI 1063]|nr:unnamed protein product [Peniophora sp. CBMAI 1063]
MSSHRTSQRGRGGLPPVRRQKISSASFQRLARLLEQYDNPPSDAAASASQQRMSETTTTPSESTSSTAATASTTIPTASSQLAKSAHPPAARTGSLAESAPTSTPQMPRPEGFRRQTEVVVGVLDGKTATKRKVVPDTHTPQSAGSGSHAALDINTKDSEWMDVDTGASETTMEEPEHPSKRARGTNAATSSTTGKKDPLEVLKHKRNILLREMVRQDGLRGIELRANGFPPCARCEDADGRVECLDCLRPGLYCSSCISQLHEYEPLHTVHEWNGDFFVSSSLEKAGLVVQLGHDGGPCAHRELQDSLLTVIDQSGIHRVRYALCKCYREGASEPAVQMMRARWWPSTWSRPKTVVTHSTLRLYHAMAMQGKINMYDFYNGIVRITDGVVRVKSSYKAFVRCVRMFRHLRQAKRAGVAQMPNGVDDVKPGDTALPCPACPRPGVNLPDGWENAPPEERFLYALLIAIDANFKLKMKDKGAKNIELGDGWSFFVGNEEYEEHLKNNTDLTEMKQCESEHNALRNANMATSKRWAVNGVGVAMCARHLLYRAQGVVDLPRGERFACIDYGVFSMLRATAKDIKTLLFSYDISCSWSVNFHTRLTSFYNHLYSLPDDAMVTFVVPKFHLEVHGEDCKCAFNLNHTSGAGRTCGEGVEAGWADMNATGVFTREMSLTHRHEVIDDFLQAINWRKIKTMDRALLKQLEEALPMAARQWSIYEKMCRTVNKEILDGWEAMVKKWDAEPVKKGKPSPYRVPVHTRTLATVRKELAQEESEEMSEGVSLHEMTASAYISSVFTLEDQTYAVNLRSQKQYQTDQEEATIQVKRNKLHHRAQALEGAQSCYVQAADGLLERVEAQVHEGALVLPPLKLCSYSKARRGKVPAAPRAAGAVILWLPSNIPPNLRGSLCVSGIALKEIKMRIAVCQDCLHNVRRALRNARAFQLDKKKLGHASQRASTRNDTTYKGIADNLNRHVARYRRSYDALLVLDPEDTCNWQDTLQELRKSDLRSPVDDEEQPISVDDQASRPAQSSEGRRISTWIWLVQEVETRDVPGARSSEDAYEHVRVEWARARSRAFRWREECLLVLEEMRRVVWSHHSTANDWHRRAAEVDSLPGILSDTRAGLRAHALRQAQVYTTLAVNSVNCWTPYLTKQSFTLAWPKAVLTEPGIVQRGALALAGGGPAPTLSEAAPGSFAESAIGLPARVSRGSGLVENDADDEDEDAPVDDGGQEDSESDGEDDARRYASDDSDDEGRNDFGHLHLNG